MFKTGVTPKELREHLLQDLKHNSFLVFIWGPPGVGKSSIVAQCASELSLRVYPLSVALEHPYSLGGFPAINWRQQQVEKFPPSYARQLENSVLFLDDFAASDPTQQRIALSLTTYRRVGDFQLPLSTRIVFASNRIEDMSYIVRPSLAVLNRMKHYNLIPSLQDWVDFMRGEQIDSILFSYALSYLNLFPQNFCHFPSILEHGEVVYPTPRTWHNLLLDLTQRRGAFSIPVTTQEEFRYVKIVSQSHVGEKVGEDFAKFLTISRECHPLDKLASMNVYEQVKAALAYIANADDKDAAVQEVIAYIGGEAAAILSFVLKESSIHLDKKAMLALKSISDEKRKRRREKDDEPSADS